MDFTDIEKKFLVMLFEVGSRVIEAQDGVIDINYETFSRDDLFKLARKLGIEDDVY